MILDSSNLMKETPLGWKSVAADRTAADLRRQTWMDHTLCKNGKIKQRKWMTMQYLVPTPGGKYQDTELHLEPAGKQDQGQGWLEYPYQWPKLQDGSWFKQMKLTTDCISPNTEITAGYKLNAKTPCQIFRVLLCSVKAASTFQMLSMNRMIRGFP